MSEAQSEPYKINLGMGVSKQIETVISQARKTNRIRELIDILERADHLLKTNPQGWGDPEYRSKYVDAIYYHATLRPVFFRYVVYEQTRGVVINRVGLYAEFT